MKIPTKYKFTKKQIKYIYLREIKEFEKILYWYEKAGYNFYYYYLKIRTFLFRKPIFINFVYETNTSCTLRCKECHSYMPYFTKDTQYMSNFETFKKELDKLLKAVDILPSFRFQGGETLLVKDLAKMVEYACSKKQIQHIQIISNGTIIPSEELLYAMKNPKVLLSLSDYSINESIKNKLKYDEILKLCRENGVNAKHWLTKAGDKWVARVVIKNNDSRNSELAIKNLRDCRCMSTVVMLFKGKLHICPAAVYFATTTPDFIIPDGEVVDILNTPQKLLNKQIKEFANKDVFYLCGRCDTTAKNGITYQPGVQLCNNKSNIAQTLVAVESNSTC